MYIQYQIKEYRLELFALLSQKWTAIKSGNKDVDLVFVQDNINHYRELIVKLQEDLK